MSSDNGNGVNAGLNKARDMLRDSIVEQARDHRRTQDEPLGARGKMPLGERMAMMADYEEAKGWGTVLDQEAERQGLQPGQIPKDVIEFAASTFKEIKGRARPV